ncbi:amidohydrolase [Sinomonas cellulolyticus]|uniref:Amidohydrolase n=1 Tax=Sinomonas cellulolyticus TaxID=2801916 RepID=A0ABS1K376_9MICC|nr:MULTISPECIES: amidohydrolase family protein [Sinomonas]MBL0705372.1 amidohydrolase [Sinomonas cellulolyticus]GHG40830.1 amidohydrolase [Sinomonas sp. KCTC 49339]
MTQTTPGPSSDAEIPAYLAALGLPGLADIHVHFLPENMLEKVWRYFDAAEESYGWPWPIAYRVGEEERLRLARGFGLAAIPALSYPHKPGMAAWLNAWSADFARRVPDAIHCATMYPEPEAGRYVAEALDAGARLFKVHVQVGRFGPDDPLLEPAWAELERAGVPIVIHAGSKPLPGEFTGPQRVQRVLERHPRLALVIAHLGMPEYWEFADLAARYPLVHLDTTMVATDFTERFAPLPEGFSDRLSDLADKVVLGSDFPNIPYPYAHQLEALAGLGLGDDWMRKVLWENGSRLLGLAG